MGRQGAEDSELRFAHYVEGLTSVIGHADRAAPLRDYCVGLLTAADRKSVEPLAAVTAPSAVSAQHQKLLHFVANAPWSDEQVLAKVREMVLPSIERHGPIEAWIIDDTAFPNTHSVGVQRQYCGQLGKQDNCQVAVTLSIANHHASLPIAYRLYIPKEWAEDAARRRKAHVPEEVTFMTKPEIALAQIGAALKAGVPRGVVLMDTSYGTNAALRSSLGALGLAYVAGIQPQTKVLAKPDRDARSRRVSVKELALGLPNHAWHTIKWREGSAECLRSRFARVRVRAAPNDDKSAACRPQETLPIEWPEGEAEPAKYWLATVAENISFRRLVDIAKLRWRIERDYQELKQEIGLGHYEGRGWPGFHHHGTLCIAAYGFLICERETIPPSGPRSSKRLAPPAIPDRYRQRGAPDPTRTSHSQLDRHRAPTIDRRHRPNSTTLPMLCTQPQKECAPCFMTQ